MRALHKSWQDKRPGWTKRVRWYQPGKPTEKIRLEFIDEFGKCNVFYVTEEEATSDYESFISGMTNTTHLRDIG